MRDYAPPTITEEQFHCPRCGTYTQQVWFQLTGKVGTWDYINVPPAPGTESPNSDPFREKTFSPRPAPAWNGGVPYSVVPPASAGVSGPDGTLDFHVFYASVCVKCRKEAIWHMRDMLYPTRGGIEPPHPELSDEIKADYNEAAAIAHVSPRGAAALLRLCIQKICVQLGFPGSNLNSDIAGLVKKGLDPDVQQALDSLRVIGNNAVHPLEMDLKDDHETARRLFSAVNFIAEQMMERPKKLSQLFAKLPEGAKEAIKKRDA